MDRCHSNGGDMSNLYFVYDPHTAIALLMIWTKVTTDKLHSAYALLTAIFCIYLKWLKLSCKINENL